MAYEHLSLDQDDQGILTVTLTRTEARNALNPELMRELTDVAKEYRSDPSLRAVILTGTPEYFSAGADLAARSHRDEKQTLMELRQTMRAGPDMCQAWEDFEPVTIAAIEGYCIGGAAALVVSCDFRIVGESAYLRLPEIPLGINMSWRSLPRIAALVGPSRAKQFVMFGEKTSAQTCLDWGMADELTADGETLAAARAWADKVAALPPLPVRMTKEAINASVNATAYATSYMDRDQYLLTFKTSDFKEGVKAFFEKRDGEFKGD